MNWTPSPNCIPTKCKSTTVEVSRIQMRYSSHYNKVHCEAKQWFDWNIKRLVLFGALRASFVKQFPLQVTTFISQILCSVHAVWLSNSFTCRWEYCARSRWNATPAGWIRWDKRETFVKRFEFVSGIDWRGAPTIPGQNVPSVRREKLAIQWTSPNSVTHSSIVGLDDQSHSGEVQLFEPRCENSTPIEADDRYAFAHWRHRVTYGNRFWFLPWQPIYIYLERRFGSGSIQKELIISSSGSSSPIW